ncbi:MAG: hypothetical protein CMF04_05375 [Hyphomonas sp.]|nr:hypothetical protein [Hyphomonas sp.]
MGLDDIFIGQHAGRGQVFAASRAVLASPLPLAGQQTNALRHTCWQTAKPLSRQPGPSMEGRQAIQAQETRQ